MKGTKRDKFMIDKLKVEEKQKELKEWLKKIDVSQLNFAERVYYHMYDNDNSEEIKRFKEKFKKDIRRSTTDIKLLESYLEILYNQEEFLKLGHTKTVFLFRNDFDDEFNGKLKVLYNLWDKFTLYAGDIIEENKGIYGDVVLTVLNENSKKSYLILQDKTCLIHSQFPDAAYARWRSLHELLVVSLFIKEHGEKCAETYLKSIKSQQKHMFEVYVKSQDKFPENEKFTNDEIEKMDEKLSEIENNFMGIVGQIVV
jgi:phosphopantetheine adenylyltransferase